MELIPNIPLDIGAIARLIDDPDDLHLVWPKARWPFDHEQWRRAMDPAMGHRSYMVLENGGNIGHAALRPTETPFIYTVNYLYLKLEYRAKGRGQILIGLLEKVAIEQLKAFQLDLVVRSYNSVALSCYMKCGFHISGQKGSLIQMSKELRPYNPS